MKPGWEVKPLGEVCKFQGGTQPPKSEFIDQPRAGYVRLLQIRDFKSDDKAVYVRDNGKVKKCESNDIMIGRYGASVGQIHRGKAGAYNVALVKTIPDSNYLNLDYFYHYLTSDLFQNRLVERKSRGAQDGFNQEDISPFPVPLPPLDEQERIVAILDEAFEGLDRARANAEANLQSARELDSTVLTLATTSPDYKRILLSEICDVRDGTHDTPKYIESGVPLVTQKNVKRDGLSLDNVKHISAEDHVAIHRRSNVGKGDILISMIGANRGMACMVDVDEIFSIKNVGLIKSTPNIDMDFLLSYLQSNEAEQYVIAETNGGAQPFIGLGKLRKFPIPYPDRAMQGEIVEKIIAVRTMVTNAIESYNLRVRLLNDLRQSLLQKAFAGELT